MFRLPAFTYTVGAILAGVTLYVLLAASRGPAIRLAKPITVTQVDKQDDFAQSHYAIPPRPGLSRHPIDSLMQAADKRFEHTLSRQTHTLNDAATAYRQRRGRHPPPGFDHWHKYASEHNAVMVEEYFDQIYHDLGPFWAISPQTLRAQTRKADMAVVVKDGRANGNNDWFWCQIWGRMINETSAYLPDMLVAVNAMDESRLLVDWETINDLMKVTEAGKGLISVERVVNKYQGWGPEKEEGVADSADIKWNDNSAYRYARSACQPSSPARQVGGILSTEKILGEYQKDASHQQSARYFDGRFVANYTEATDYCSDASIGGLHGALMHPLTTKVTNVLLPLFGGSKFHANNDILLPAPMYWNDEVRFGGGSKGDEIAWNSKNDTVLWRGQATGGRSKPYSWNLFHRHRFVAVTNATKYDLSSPTSDPIFSPFFHEGAIKHLNRATQAHLSQWLSPAHDVSFTNLQCDELESDGGCWYMNDEYAMSKEIEFGDHFNHKYLPDIDGNSFSGRYRAFLLSNSLPIKATIYREWHDSRLLAWKHFVPMNNRFSDYYPILEYFRGSQPAGLPGHDNEARKIATEGRAWAEKVLRKADMQIYVGRLLLEYARLTDDKREVLGWVDDLLPKHDV